jgi:hypothetical protein
MEKLQEIMLDLIKDYIACAEYMCNILRDEYNIKSSLLRARRTNIIPKEGKLLEGSHFNFHGGGCNFEFENGSIDVDFGPNDRSDGFDYRRLYNYLIDTKKDIYKELSDINILKMEFDNLILNGRIKNPEWHPNSYLFYLSERVDG